MAGAPIRQLIAMLAVAALSAGLLLPPLHAHHRSNHHDQSARLVHRHLASHHEGHTTSGLQAADDHAFARLIDASGIVSTATPRPLAPAVPTIPTQAPPADDIAAALPLWAPTAPPHGPPRATLALRAPPALA